MFGAMNNQPVVVQLPQPSLRHFALGERSTGLKQNARQRHALADCEAGVRVKAGGVDQHGNYATMLVKK